MAFLVKKQKLSEEAIAVLKDEQTTRFKAAVDASASDVADGSHMYAVSVYSDSGNVCYDRYILGLYKSLEAAQEAVKVDDYNMVFIERVPVNAAVTTKCLEVCTGWHSHFSPVPKEAVIGEWYYPEQKEEEEEEEEEEEDEKEEKKEEEANEDEKEEKEDQREDAV